MGLTLRVRPQISEGDTVRLELFQEISSIDTNPGVQGSDLITKKRSIKTVVLANNDEMIVLGGLMRDDSTASVQRVPCIGAAPIIGEPFKFTENQNRKTNLMVFLKPNIIATGDQVEAITNRKYSNIKGSTSVRSRGTIVFPRKEQKLPDDLRPEGKSSAQRKQEAEGETAGQAE